MKILWVSHLVPFPPKAGVLLRAYNLLKELSRQNEVDLVALNQKNLIEPYFEDYAAGTEIARNELQKFCGNLVICDLPIDKARWMRAYCAIRSLFSRFPYSVNWLESTEFERQFLKLINENEYDLVHFDTIGLAPLITHVNRSATSLDHHNIESNMLFRRVGQESNPLKKMYFYQEAIRLERLEKKFCALVNTNITCSDIDTERLLQLIPEAQAHTIANGVDIEVFKPAAVPASARKIVFIGTLDWYPNIRAVRYLALEIFPLVKKKFPDVELDIIGANPPQDLIAVAKTEPNIHVHGFVDDIFPYMAAASVYACPINDGGGTKLKLLDAFACGKAVVADPIACEGLAIEDGEQVLLASSAEDFSDRISTLFEDESLRQSLEQNARKHVVDKFSFRSIGRELSDHYRSVSQVHQQRFSR